MGYRRRSLIKMEDDFLLQVTWKGKEYEFPVRVLNFGYVTKLEVEINDIKVQFERDDEANWRAIMSNEDIQAGKQVDKSLLLAVAEVIEEVTK